MVGEVAGTLGCPQCFFLWCLRHGLGVTWPPGSRPKCLSFHLTLTPPATKKGNSHDMNDMNDTNERNDTNLPRPPLPNWQPAGGTPPPGGGPPGSGTGPGKVPDSSFPGALRTSGPDLGAGATAWGCPGHLAKGLQGGACLLARAVCPARTQPPTGPLAQLPRRWSQGGGIP